MRKLPKPTVAAWAVNQLARRHRDDLDALLEAGDRLRAAHEGLLRGERSEAVSEAAAAEREAVGRLVHHARRLEGVSDAALERVAQTLHAAAGSDEVRDEVGRGVVAREHQPAMFGGLAAGTPAPAPPAPRRQVRKPARRKGEDAAARKRREERERREREERERQEARELRELLRSARAERRKLEGAHGKARRALDAAEGRLARAREDLAKREREAAAAREREEQARSDLSDSEDQVRRLEG